MIIRKIFICLMMAVFLASGPAWAAPAETTAVPGSPLAVIPSFSPVVEKAEPAVVNISATKVVKGRQSRNSFGENPFGRDDDLFDRFFGGPQGDRKEQSLGSGFLFDPAGYIITNNHVVEGAEDIIVKIASGEEIHAEIIGRDPKTDLALIKLKKAGTYPYLSLGDSSQLKIGDWVVAIGNPFGLDHTVTAGILSARSRAIGAGPYDDFLQTDASINPGNSGGPLLNLFGDVIGINTAIVAGGTGIGFAIPTNLAKGVVEQLKNKGRVVRGWMGVVIQKLTPELAKSYGLGEPRGALVGDIDPEGPSVAAKLKRGDIILKFDGQEVKSWQDLPIIVANTDVGKKVKLVVYRDKKEIPLDLTVAELKDDGGAAGAGGQQTLGKLGLSLREITPEMASRLKLTDRDGLYIADIEAASPAGESGLVVGDIVMEVDDQPVKTIDDYRRVVGGTDKEDIVRFLIKRGGNTMFFTITVGE